MESSSGRAHLGPNDRTSESRNAEIAGESPSIQAVVRITPDTVKRNLGSLECDFGCKQNCVRDCSCVSHCSWIVA
jgi:hypothetical protein